MSRGLSMIEPESDGSTALFADSSCVRRLRGGLDEGDRADSNG